VYESGGGSIPPEEEEEGVLSNVIHGWFYSYGGYFENTILKELLQNRGVKGNIKIIKVTDVGTNFFPRPRNKFEMTAFQYRCGKSSSSKSLPIIRLRK
jgi:hypothetical protein